MERTKQRTKIKESTGERIFTGVIYAILILFCAIIVFPLLHIVSGSFSDPMALLRGEVSFWPKGFTFSMYEKVFKDASIWQGYGNTIVYTVLGTCISVVLTAFAAYPLSRKDFYGRNLFMGVFVFTMFFTGGMIPTFLIVQRRIHENDIPDKRGQQQQIQIPAAPDLLARMAQSAVFIGAGGSRLSGGHGGFHKCVLLPK